MRRAATLLALVAVALPALASAHGDEHPGHGANQPRSTTKYPWGHEADASRAARTIEVEMADTMRFTPSELTVKAGEPVRFAVRNRGAVMHEMVIGTEEGLAEHAAMMRKHPDMQHDEPYMAHVKPGGREEIAWVFDKPGTYRFGCLVPGHWEAGMKGTIRVTAR